MAEPNPQPEAEAAPAAPPSKGGSIMGPIVAAIIIVAGIAGVFNFMVVPALKPPETKTPTDLTKDAHKANAGEQGGSHHGGAEAAKVPFELGESILVNIKGENNKVLSAKVGFLLRTTIEGEKVEDDVKLLETHLGKFKSMLVAATRGYFVELNENDLEVPEDVHRQQLKIKLKSTFFKIRSYDSELIRLLTEDPVEEVYLPYFTHQ
tara:strand:- start:1295 stop:1915 length:621 start_codon:yes stop_codon:yes gene_type:complete